MSIKSTLKARRRRRRILWASLVVVVVAVIVVAYLVSESLSSPYTSYIDTPVSASIFRGLAVFSSSSLAAVGSGSANAPRAITGSALTNNGKPEVLYVGGEYCPYCAVTRWSMIIALSKFGNFTGVEYMLSTATDVNPNTPTFTFASASYTSSYVSFVTVEHWDRSDDIFQPLSTQEQSLFSQYDPSGGIPFIDFGNQYLVTGVTGGLSTLDLSGMNWTQVVGQLNVPSSQIAQAMVGESNYIISAICAIDGNQPSSVCSQPFATLTLAHVSAGTQPSQTSVMAIPPDRLGLL